jgi:2-dehydro-3-deoxy-D-pentonate aldolase
MFEGLMPALVTPFDEDGEIDLQATEAIVERHIEAGVDGISALGSTGEFSHLTNPERRRFAEALVGMIDGRVPLVVGVGTTGTREAVDLARHAESVGADGVLSVSPFYWKVGEEALFKHFVTVAESVEIPTLVYNFPMLTGVDLSPALVGRLAAECPSIIGIKDTVKEYMHTVNVLREAKESRPDFTVLVGFEDQILPALLAGADGAICGLSNIAPELFVGLVRAFEGGDLAKATELHRRILPLMAIYTLSDPGLGAAKLAMKKLGVPLSPTVRGPALPAPPGSEETIEVTLEASGLLPVQGEA